MQNSSTNIHVPYSNINDTWQALSDSKLIENTYILPIWMCTPCFLMRHMRACVQHLHMHSSALLPPDGDLRQRQHQPIRCDTIHSFRCRSQCERVHTELRQRKLFFLQEWVTLVSMELFTWRPAAKAKVLSSIGFYASLWRQQQRHIFLCLCRCSYERASNVNRLSSFWPGGVTSCPSPAQKREGLPWLGSA